MPESDWRSRLRAAVEADGRTREEIAAAASVYLSRLQPDSDALDGIYLAEVIRLAAVLNVSVGWLVDGVDHAAAVKATYLEAYGDGYGAADCRMEHAPDAGWQRSIARAALPPVRQQEGEA